MADETRWWLLLFGSDHSVTSNVSPSSILHFSVGLSKGGLLYQRNSKAAERLIKREGGTVEKNSGGGVDGRKEKEKARREEKEGIRI